MREIIIYNVRRIDVQPMPSFFSKAMEGASNYLGRIFSYCPSDKILWSGAISFIFGTFSTFLTSARPLSSRTYSILTFWPFIARPFLIVGFGWIAGKYVTKIIEQTSQQIDEKIVLAQRSFLLLIYSTINCFSLHDLIYEKGRFFSILNIYLSIFSGAISAYYHQQTQKNR